MSRPFDFTIYPYSKISRLPKYLHGPALIVRNIMTKAPKYRYAFDGMATAHNFSFLDDPRFKAASQKAISAGGFDYQIHLRLHQAIWCADKAMKLSPESVFVELGTGKGYVMSGILGALEFVDLDYAKKSMYLFDTYDSSSTDFKSEQITSLGPNIYYAESFEQVERNFLGYPTVKLVKGKLPKTLDILDNEQISFLHIDLNAPEIEVECLRTLWNKILPGGVILIDDYAYNGLHYTYMLFNQIAQELGVSILTTASGQGLVVK